MMNMIELWLTHTLGMNNVIFTTNEKVNKMNEGRVAVMVILILWGIFGMACSISCAIFTIKNATKTWYKIAGWVLAFNLALTILGMFMRMGG